MTWGLAMTYSLGDVSVLAASASASGLHLSFTTCRTAKPWTAWTKTSGLAISHAAESGRPWHGGSLLRAFLAIAMRAQSPRACSSSRARGRRRSTPQSATHMPRSDPLTKFGPVDPPWAGHPPSQTYWATPCDNSYPEPRFDRPTVSTWTDA